MFRACLQQGHPHPHFSRVFRAIPNSREKKSQISHLQKTLEPHKCVIYTETGAARHHSHRRGGTGSTPGQKSCSASSLPWPRRGTWNKKSARTVVYGFIPNHVAANKPCHPVGVPHTRNYHRLSSTPQHRDENRSLNRNSLIRISQGFPGMGWRCPQLQFSTRDTCSRALHQP